MQTPTLARRRFDLAAVRAWLGAALERQRSRRALACLTDAELADIGLTRAEARAESGKPFWR